MNGRSPHHTPGSVPRVPVSERSQFVADFSSSSNVALRHFPPSCVTESRHEARLAPGLTANTLSPARRRARFQRAHPPNELDSYRSGSRGKLKSGVEASGGPRCWSQSAAAQQSVILDRNGASELASLAGGCRLVNVRESTESCPGHRRPPHGSASTSASLSVSLAN